MIKSFLNIFIVFVIDVCYIKQYDIISDYNKSTL